MTRLRRCQCLMLVVLCVNFAILYYFWKLQNNLSLTDAYPKHSLEDDDTPEQDEENGGRGGRRNSAPGGGAAEFSQPLDPLEDIPKLVTIVLREFEFFENDIAETIQSFLRLLPGAKICLLADAYPYPPLSMDLNMGRNVEIVVLHPKIDEPLHASKPEHHIQTPLVLLVPDSVRLTSVTQIYEMMSYLVPTNQDQIVAARVAGEKSRCTKLSVRLREWTLEAKEESSRSHCDALQGTHVMLMNTKQLFNLSQPFARPFPYALFIQMSVKNWKIHILDRVVFQQGRPLFLEAHSKWKHESAHKERLKMLFEDFGVKKLNEGGVVDWYGCTKTSNRCFGTVVNDMPEYLYAGRWTPPCCLEALRETGRYVFKILKGCGVRYWLEGGSLLGAVRNGDIIPWDYDIDVGIYEEDVAKCDLLSKASKQPVIDEADFVWEKASEGDFYRVQFSQTNHLHVDIFPFFPKDGVMTKRTWFRTHRQDREFSENFLRPLTTIPFIGVEASAPNNINEFLELKFGEGVVTNPQYPNPKLLKFPNVSITVN